MKYIIFLVLLLSGILFFINKDDILSRYSNMNRAEVVYSDYKEPVVDRMGKVKKTTKVVETGTNNKNVALSYGPMYGVSWTRYINETFYDVLYNQVYQSGTVVTYTLSDYDFLTKNGFFLGWFGPQSTVPAGGYMSDHVTFSLFGNTGVSTKYNYCAELSPDTAFFESVNDLERKMVQFANNKGDSVLGIKAEGETAATAIVYSDGGVCAKFKEGCLGEVSCNSNDDKEFFKAYQDKSISSMIVYHTHDYNTTNNRDWWPVYDEDGNKVGNTLTAPPSFEDLKANWYFKGILSTNGVFPNLNLIEKVISSNGKGYIYDVSKKTTIAKKNDNELETFQKKFVSDFSNIRLDSMKKYDREDPTVKDTQVAYNFILDTYKKMGVTVKTFTVQ